MSAPPASPPSPLSHAFAHTPLASHPAQWDALYRAARTPWDRAAPSLALADLLAQRPDLVPPPSARPRPAALVPGCGPGHDVLLLAARGYDVCGLDCSPDALRRAEENRVAAAAADAATADADAVPPGRVTWLEADFFDDAWSAGMGSDGSGSFDLVFDYTFLCALPPEARPRWARRMSQLVHPTRGRLVCLEFPTGKPPSEPGPPWGLAPELYEALLAAPGHPPRYAPDGSVVPAASAKPCAGALHRLSILKPARTHAAGTAADGAVLDFISVWAP